MAPTSLIFVAIATLLYFGNGLFHFLKQLRKVRASGIPYVIIPFLSFATIPRILTPIWRPILRRLPQSLRGDWYAYMEEESQWRWLHNVNKKLGSDTIITISLDGTVFCRTADANVISEVTARKNDFIKPLEFYRILNLYGKNVLSTEGHTWRRHRKVVGPPFTERNNHLVWTESLYSAQKMIESRLRADGRGTDTIEDLEPLTGRLALSIISKAGFGVRLAWPDRDGKYASTDDPSSDPALSRAWIDGKTHGHTMSFGDSILELSYYIILVLICPRWLLKNLPFKSTKTAYAAWWNWGNYMREMITAKRKYADNFASDKQSYDLLANLVKVAGDSSTVFDETDKSAHPNGNGNGNGTSNAKSASPPTNPQDKFTDEEILGNAFAIILAGHETTSGTLQHASLFLAMNLASQRALQSDLDSILPNPDSSTWDYETDFPRIFGGMTGAILAEVLRIIPPVLVPPKVAPHDTSITIDGVVHPIAAGTNINIEIASVQRNPKFWPHGPADPRRPSYAGSEALNPENDLAEFRPERWLLSDSEASKTPASTSTKMQMPEQRALTAEEKALGLNLAADTAASLYKPAKGAYLPFHEGARACMGRRFAQVEVMAILAVFFRSWSVELAVDQWASDEEVEKMSREEKRVVWEKARKEAERLFSEAMGSIVTHKMIKGKVPVRFVRRGEERFGFRD